LDSNPAIKLWAIKKQKSGQNPLLQTGRASRATRVGTPSLIHEPAGARRQGEKRTTSSLFRALS
jgi:hypothetical protein